MNKRLIFRGYATRDLDAAGARFREVFGKEPEAFVVQKGYTVYGSRKNHDKTIESRFGGYAAVYIPLYLSRDELITLDAERISAPTQHEPEIDELNDDRALLWDETLRYCFYCGQIFRAEIMSDEIHCDKPACIQRHSDRLSVRQETRDTFRKPKPSNGGERRNWSSDEPKRQDVVVVAPTVYEVRQEPIYYQELEQEPAPAVALDDDFTLDDIYSTELAGWVYLIESDNGLYKLGRSNDVWKRFSNLAMENAANLTMRHAIKAADYFRAEAWIHQQFAAKRHHGEWFSLSQGDIEWFCNLSDGALDGV